VVTEDVSGILTDKHLASVDIDRTKEQPTMTLEELFQEVNRRREQGNWVPACNGTEVPFTSRSGLRLLYCWQQSTGRHAYINCDTDILLSDEETQAALLLA
jgi:hypothetical protein